MSNNGVFVCFFLNNCHVSIDSILHCYIPNRVSRYLRLVCIWDSVLVLNGGSVGVNTIFVHVIWTTFLLRHILYGFKLSFF